MNKFRKIELGLVGIFFLLTIIQLNRIDVLAFLLLFLLLLIGFWIFSFIQSKKINSIGFGRRNIVEKLLLSFLLMGIALNISRVAYSSPFIKLALLILAFYYLINGIVKWVKQKQEWFNGIERIILGLILFGFLFRFMSWPGSGVLRVFPLLALFVLMGVYSILSIVSLSKNNKSTLGILTMLVYWSISLSVLFILFDCMLWPGTVPIFIVYGVFMLFTSVPYFIKYFSIDLSILSADTSSLLYNTTRRIIVYSIFCLFLFFLSREQFERFQFGNRPALIQAVILGTSSEDNGEKVWGRHEASRLDSLWREGKYPEEI